MRRTRVHAALCLWLALAAGSGSVCLAQGAVDLVSRLQASQEATSIDTGDLLPWHLKLAITLNDAQGKPVEQGTVEEFWAGPEKRLIAYSMPSYNGKFLQNEEGEFWTSDAGSPSMLIPMLLDQVVHPMPSKKEVDGTEPELRKEKFGKVELDCIMLSHRIKNVAYLPLGLYPTYCFDPGRDVLRMSYSLGSLATVRNTLGVFQKRYVAQDVRVEENLAVAGSAQVMALTGLHVDPAMFLKTVDMRRVGQAAHIEGPVVAGTILKKQVPVYPVSARAHRTEGTVLLHAIIGRDGHIHSLEVTSTPDADLALSALEAVRHWTYKPYLLNGEPTEVDTTITVNYRIGL